MALNKVDIFGISATRGNDPIEWVGAGRLAILSILGAGPAKMINANPGQQITDLPATVKNAMNGQVGGTKCFEFR